MIFNSKFDFEEYLSKNGLEIIGDYPASFKEDQRDYRLGVLLGTQDLAKYSIKIDTDAGFPMAVIFDDNN